MQTQSTTRWALGATVSLFGLAATGCIVSEPQRLEAQERIPPRVLYDTVFPQNNTVYQLHVNDEDRTFSVGFVSEDIDEDVHGRLFLNYGLPGQVFLGDNDALASTIEDEERVMRVQWNTNPVQDFGCYLFTMTIAHRGNYPTGETTSSQQGPINENDAAIVTWTVAYGEGPEFFSLEDCPQDGTILESAQ